MTIKTFRDFLKFQKPINLDRRRISIGFHRPDQEKPINVDDQNIEFGIGSRNSVVSEDKTSDEAAFSKMFDYGHEKPSSHSDNTRVGEHANEYMIHAYGVKNDDLEKHHIELSHHSEPHVGRMWDDSGKQTDSENAHPLWHAYSEDSSMMNMHHAHATTIHAHNSLTPTHDMDASTKNYSEYHSDDAGPEGHPGRESGGHYRNNIAHMDAAFHPLHKDMTVFSGVKQESHGDTLGAAMKSGATFHSNRYTSTSLSPNIAVGFSRDHNHYDGKTGAMVSGDRTRHVMKIHIPAGHPHVYLSGISRHGPAEKELVLPRNTLFRHTGRVDTHKRAMGSNEVKYNTGSQFSEGNHVTHIHHLELVHPDDHHKYGHEVFHKGGVNLD